MIATLEARMAKKKAQSSSRKVQTTAEELELMADDLRHKAGQISRLAEHISKSGRESIGIDGHGQWERGVAQLDAYILNIQKALLNAGIAIIE